MEAVQDQWVWIALEHSGKTLKGWIDSRHVVGCPSIAERKDSPRIPANYVGIWAWADGTGQVKTFQDGNHMGLLIIRAKFLIWVERSLAPGPADFQTCTVSCPTTWKLDATAGTLAFTARQSVGINLSAKQAMIRDAAVTIRQEKDGLLVRTQGDPEKITRPDVVQFAPGSVLMNDPAGKRCWRIPDSSTAVAPGFALVVSATGDFSLVGSGDARTYVKIGK